MNVGTFRMLLKSTILHTARALGLFHMTRRYTRERLLILCYHGFESEDVVKFRPGLFMRQPTFGQHLAAIRRGGFKVLPLSEAIERLQQRELPPNSVCITIDDGFKSVLRCAAPLLQRYGFPATLYTTTYYVQKDSPIFRLVIQYMFWKTTVRTLSLVGRDWGVPEQTDLSNAGARERTMWLIIEYGERHCDEPRRIEISIVLAEQLCVDYERIHNSGMLSLLDKRELSELAGYGIDIQLHAHRHTLPVDDEQAVRREIAENRVALREIASGPLVHLAYPSGIWDRQEWPWLREADVVTATTCTAGMNTADTPLLGLYRVLDDERVSEIDFEAELNGFAECWRLISGRRRRDDQTRALLD